MIVKNLDELELVAKKIKNKCKANLFILMDGDFGAGKTALSKMIIKELGVTNNVNSPTFNILNQYYSNNNLKINHMDAYRLTAHDEVEMYEEQFENSLNIIEWYKNLNINFKNMDKIIVKIKVIENEYRDIQIEDN